MKKRKVEKDMIKEIKKDLNFVEKIKVGLNKKLSCKIYKKGIRKGFNWGMKGWK